MAKHLKRKRQVSLDTWPFLLTYFFEKKWNYSRKVRIYAKSSVKAMIIERNNYLNQLLDYRNWQPTRDEKDSS